MDAETVLFVDDDKNQIVIFDLFLKQRMRAGDNIDFAAFQPFQNGISFAPLFAACKKRRFNPASRATLIVAKCRRASTSVGAMSADCPPDSAAWAMESRPIHGFAGNRHRPAKAATCAGAI